MGDLKTDFELARAARLMILLLVVGLVGLVPEGLVGPSSSLGVGIPDLVFIGTDGGNEVFAIRAGDGHYVAATLIGMSPEAVKDCGVTFTDFVRSFP